MNKHPDIQFASVEPLLRQAPQVLVAYSGGVDSHVLLHLLSQYHDLKLQVIHINHGLQTDATRWQHHCEVVTQSLGLPFMARQVHVVKKPRHSLEAQARDCRYRVFEEVLEPGGVLVTGHNQNDQAETVLLQLMRGAGVSGLSAMPQAKAFGQGLHCRPLLSVSRAQITDYALTQQLQWIEDPTNAANDFDRNFLRLHIVPELETRRQGVVANIARSAEHCAVTAQLLNELAEMDYPSVQGKDKQYLSVAALNQLSPARQDNVIRYWLRQLHVIAPSQAIMQQIRQQLLQSYLGAKPQVCWGQVKLERISIDGGYYIHCQGS